MSSEQKQTDVKQDIQSVRTVEEFDALLEVYKKQNPQKYAIKLGSGEYDKFRATLVSEKPKKEVKEPKVK